MMEWAEWSPLYLEILADMGYDHQRDEEAAGVIAGLILPRQIPACSAIVELIGQRVSIMGPAPSLEADLGSLPEGTTVISAGSATGRLMEAGLRPDIIVTDLDGDAESDAEANSKGALAFVHAHGDNAAAIREWVPRMTGAMVPTVQCRPLGDVYNFGGFTDGDRAFFIAEHFGAKYVSFKGWDLTRPSSKRGCDPVQKRRKLQWAARLLQGRIDGNGYIISPTI